MQSRDLSFPIEVLFVNWQEILTLAPEVAQEKGLEHTPKEIAQQPDLWREVSQIVAARLPEIKKFLQAKDDPDRLVPIILTGAGSSEFVGRVVESSLGNAGLDAVVRPTTDIVVWPKANFPKHESVLVSFARSGNSPESVAAIQLATELNPHMRHLIVTCNAEGELARWAQTNDQALVIVLPERSNDRGLAMTSSFTSMIVAAQALAWLDDAEGYRTLVEQQATQAEVILTRYADSLFQLANEAFHRIIFLGSGALYGLSIEAKLKSEELTTGRIVAKAESMLGVRHGPMVSIDRDSLVVYFLSSDPYVRLYEKDVIDEIRQKDIAGVTAIIGENIDSSLADNVDYSFELGRGHVSVLDLFKGPVYAVAAQILALALSMRYGRKPDNPGEGVINRVVAGVKIYPFSVSNF